MLQDSSGVESTDEEEEFSVKHHTWKMRLFLGPLQWYQPGTNGSIGPIDIWTDQPIPRWYRTSKIYLWRLAPGAPADVTASFQPEEAQEKKKSEMRSRCVAVTGPADGRGAPCGATPAYQLHPPGRLRDAGCHFNHRYPLPSSKSHHQ